MDAAYARLLRIVAASGLPRIDAVPSYGTPGLKVAGKFLARLLDGDTLVIRCALDEKTFLIAADPAVFFETDHYKGYDAVLMRLTAADDTAILGRLEAAWRMQAPRRLVATYQGAVKKA
jgi:hypothetical protein